MRVELSKGHWAEVEQATVRIWRAQHKAGVSLIDQTDVSLDLAQRCITSWSREGEITVDALEDLPLSDFNAIMAAVNNGDDSPLGLSPAPSTVAGPLPGSGNSASPAKRVSRRRSVTP